MRSVIEEAIERAVTEKEIIKDHRYTCRRRTRTSTQRIKSQN